MVIENLLQILNWSTYGHSWYLSLCKPWITHSPCSLLQNRCHFVIRELNMCLNPNVKIIFFHKFNSLFSDVMITWWQPISIPLMFKMVVTSDSLILLFLASNRRNDFCTSLDKLIIKQQSSCSKGAVRMTQRCHWGCCHQLWLWFSPHHQNKQKQQGGLLMPM